MGSILVAVGFQEFDARKLGNYGYGRFPNVVTSLELERMLNASGVTQGHVVRPSDHEDAASGSSSSSASAPAARAAGPTAAASAA